MALVFIKSQSASDSAGLSFVSGARSVVFDGTYKEYKFYIVNLHPTTNAYYLSFKTSTDAGSSYGVSSTTTYYRMGHTEAGSTFGASYVSSYDHTSPAEEATTDPIYLAEDTGSDDADKSISAVFTIYDPASPTYVKHFQAETITCNGGDQQTHQHVAGYVNTAADVDAIKFQFSHGNIATGTIYMYGVS